MVADDLDGVLVGPDGSVGAQAPELAADRSLGRGLDVLQDGQGAVADVVDDADGEAVAGLVELEVVEHGLDVAGRRVLGAQPVAAADDPGRGTALVEEQGADVLIEGLAQGAGLLAAVQNRDGLDGGGQHAEEVFRGEGTVQVHLDHPDLFAPCAQVVYGLLDSLADGPHCDDDMLRVRRTIVGEGVVAAPRELLDLLHVALDGVGDIRVEGLRGLLGLEEDVRVLRRPLLEGVLGPHGPRAEHVDGIIVHQPGEVVVVERVDLLDLVGGAEAVEEVQEGDARPEAREVRDGGHVHSLLYAPGGEHRKPRHARGHNVAVVAEDGEGVPRDGPGRDVEDARHQLPRDLEHVGYHQQQPLGCRERGGQRSCRQGPVHGARGAPLGLELRDLDGLPEDVFAPVSRPFVDQLGHG